MFIVKALHIHNFTGHSLHFWQSITCRFYSDLDFYLEWTKWKSWRIWSWSTSTSDRQSWHCKPGLHVSSFSVKNNRLVIGYTDWYFATHYRRHYSRWLSGLWDSSLHRPTPWSTGLKLKTTEIHSNFFLKTIESISNLALKIKIESEGKLAVNLFLGSFLIKGFPANFRFTF